MAITISAENWAKSILPITLQAQITSGLTYSPENWSGAKTFHAPSLSVGGARPIDRTAVGRNSRKTTTLTDNIRELTFERTLDEQIAKGDIVDNNYLPVVGRVAGVFAQTQQLPEFDALTFSRISAAAAAAQTGGTAYGTVYEESTAASITTANVFSTLDAMLTKSRLATYQAQGQTPVCYVSMDIWRKLRVANEFQHRMDVIVSDGSNGRAIGTVIGSINGVKIVPVLDDTRRFHTAFDFTDGFVPAVSAQALNVLIAVPGKAIFVKKYDDMYLSNPGENGNGNNYGLEAYYYCDCFVMPNGYDNKIDGVYVNAQPAESI